MLSLEAGPFLPCSPPLLSHLQPPALAPGLAVIFQRPGRNGTLILGGHRPQEGKWVSRRRGLQGGRSWCPPPASRWAAPFTWQKPAPTGALACRALRLPAADPGICPVPISIICRMLSPRHSRRLQEAEEGGGGRSGGRKERTWPGARRTEKRQEQEIRGPVWAS